MKLLAKNLIVYTVALFVAFVFSGCSKPWGKLAAQDTYLFNGIGDLTSNGDGTWTLSWEKSSSEGATYSVYRRDPKGSFDFSNPVAKGISGVTWVTPDLGSYFPCFAVRLEVIGSDWKDSNIIERCSSPQPLYRNFPGCTDKAILSSSSIQIQFAWPAGASQMQVVRDGVVAYQTDQTSVTSFNDTGLLNTNTYEYKCRAIINNTSIDGTSVYHLQPLTVTAATTGSGSGSGSGTGTQSSASPFDGCVTATATSSTSITLQYALPTVPGSSVTSMNLYRNGVLLTSSNASGSYVDTGLTGGQSVSYTCKAMVDGKEVAGVKSISISTPVPSQNPAQNTTPPSVFNVAVSNSTPGYASPNWNLTWSYNHTVSNQTVAIKVFRIETVVGSNAFPDGLGAALFTQGASAATANQTYNLAVNGETGQWGQNIRIAYLIQATDAQGNIGSATVAVNANLTLPAFGIINVSENATVESFAKEFTGTCDSSAGNVTLSTLSPSTSGTVQSTSCVANVLNVRVHFTEGSGPRAITVTTTKPDTSSTSITRNINFHKPCPNGFVGVPGKWSNANSTTPDTDIAGLGNINAAQNASNVGLDPTKDFCVMKYPAKKASSNRSGQSPWDVVDNTVETGFTTAYYWPQSRSNGIPWIPADVTEAADRCKALNEAYGLCSGTDCYTSFDNSTVGFRLISNTQYQVLARNIEQAPSNWSNGAALGVGSGVLNKGLTGCSVTNTQSRWDNNPYFGAPTVYGTWNTLGVAPAGTSYQKRTYNVLSGSILWDLGGQPTWVSDLNIDGTGSSNDMGASASLRSAALTTLDFNSGSLSASDLLLFGSKGGYTSTKNTGVVYARNTMTSVFRGGSSGPLCAGTVNGIFTTVTSSATTLRPGSVPSVGFRCTYTPPTSGADTNPPSVSSLGRIDSSGNSIANNPVTIVAGGTWNLGWTVSDAENTGVNASKILVQIRRKISNSNSDFPTQADTIYKSGFNLNSLTEETAWILDAVTLQYTKNDGKYVNYLVSAKDPAGNIGESTLSVEVTQSCPPGYIGIPSNNIAGLGNINAVSGHSNAQLDPSKAFCIMKYPAKVMTANTSYASTVGGGKLEPIFNGGLEYCVNWNSNGSDFSYADAGAFDTKVSYIPDSRAQGAPWATILRDDANGACQALQMAYFGTMPDTTTGSGFQLISNTQWQIVARNIEAQSLNWSNGNSGGQGSGVLNQGWSNGTNSGKLSETAVPTSLVSGNAAWNRQALATSLTDANGYYGTTGSASGAWNTLGITPPVGSEQKRTFTLSNGFTLWDMAGNVAQWVNDNNLGTGGANDIGISNALRTAGGNVEFSSGTLTASDKKLFGPAGNFDSSQSAGMTNINTDDGIIRGGRFHTSSSINGIFGVETHESWNIGNDKGIGFRCTYNP